MAIFQPPDGGTPPQSSTGITITTGAQGQPVMNQSNNNRIRRSASNYRKSSATTNTGDQPQSNPSPEFYLLDNLIIDLDADFDALPLT
jgi:hypothetical protein